MGVLSIGADETPKLDASLRHRNWYRPASGDTPTPPDAPTLDSATAGDGLVDLVWTAGGGGAATSYTVSRGTSAGSETQLAAGVTGTSYTDDTALNGVTYYYTVQAVNSAGTSAASNETSATPNPATIPDPIAVAAGAVGTAGPLVLTAGVDVPEGSTLLAAVSLTFSTAPDSLTITDAAGNDYLVDVPAYATSFNLDRARVTAAIAKNDAITVTATGGAVSAIVATVDAVISAAITPDAGAPTNPTGVGNSTTHQIATTEIPGRLMYGVDVAFGAEAHGPTTSAPFTQANASASGTGHGTATAYELPTTGNAVDFTDTLWATGHSGAMIVVPYKLI